MNLIAPTVTVDVPDWVVYPDDDWTQISPAAAGLDADKFAAWLSDLDVKGANFGGEDHSGKQHGAVARETHRSARTGRGPRRCRMGDWLRGHSGGNKSGASGECEHFTAMGVVTTIGLPDYQHALATKSILDDDFFVGDVNPSA